MRFLLPKESYRTEPLQVFTGGILFPAGMSWLTQVTNTGCCRCGYRGSLGRAHPSPFSGSWPRAPAWPSLPQRGSRSHRTQRRLCPPIQHSSSKSVCFTSRNLRAQLSRLREKDLTRTRFRCPAGLLPYLSLTVSFKAEYTLAQKLKHRQKPVPQAGVLEHFCHWAGLK